MSGFFCEGVVGACAALVAGAAATACYSKPECDYGVDEYTGAGWSFDEAVDPELTGTAWQITAEDPGTLYQEALLYGWMRNANPNADCLVALYVSAEPPDPNALPMIGPDTPPPASIAGLGERVFSANLPRDYDPNSETDDAHVSVYIDPLGSSAVPVSIYVTLATCTSGGVSAWLDPELLYCDTFSSSPRVREEGVRTDAFTVQKIW